MRPLSRLKHAAAGMLGSLINRNNDINGYWAPGVLYHDVSAAPNAMEIDLLSGAAQPAGANATLIAAVYTVFLRTALKRVGFEWEALTRATINFQFKAEVSNPDFDYPCGGDPFICTVTLQSVQGYAATVSARARCRPYQPYLFTRSTRSAPSPPQTG